MFIRKCFGTFLLVIFTCSFYDVHGADHETNRGIKCTKYHTSCANGEKCIEDLRMCDGIEDCADHSDEENCGDACDSYQYKCKSGECIRKELLCDGALDCHSDEDENDCKEKDCTEEEFKCSTVEHCIPSGWQCDGKTDCSDGSDERNCSSSCPDGYNVCTKSKRCIPTESFCDGILDCDGGTDEKVCVGKNTPTKCSSENGLFLCKDKKKCLGKILVCDGKEQCDDGSDENGNCDIRCEDLELPCLEECFRTPDGPKCHCRKGYEHVKNKSCSEFDECAAEIQVCDHFCENTKGSYKCKCAKNYKLLDDGSTCRIPGAAMLLFSVGNDVQGIILDGSDSFQEYKGTYEASGIAFDPELEKVFWIVNQKNVYVKTLRKTEDPILFIEHGLQEAENLACDWFGHNLYITDHKKNHILACSIDYTHCKVVIKHTSGPRALQLDLEERTIYWTATVSNRIEKAGLDGSDRKVIIKDDIVWTNGLALDYPAKRVYWIDSNLDQIDSANYSGEDRKRIANRDASHPYSLAVWQDRIYWTDWEKDHHREIHSCRKRDSKHWKSLYKDSKRTVGNLMIYHSSMFEHATNPCKNIYGYSCSHLCLLSPSAYKGYVCECPEGMTLTNDTHNCAENHENIPVVAMNSKLFFVYARKYGKDFIDAKKMDISLGTVAAMDYNLVKNMLYFADPKKERIIELNFSNKETRTVIEKIKQPTAIAVDSVRDNLYWINSHHHSIELVRTSGQFRRTLIHNALAPTDLALDVLKGYLFVSYGSNLPSIKKCRLNGSNCTDIVSENILKISSIAIDIMENPAARIYWTDTEKNTIESVDANGRNRREDFRRLKHPMKVKINGGNIFWTERRSSVLYVASKNVNEVIKHVMIKGTRPNAEEWAMALTVVNISKSNMNTDLCFGVGNKCHQFCFTISSDQKECGCSQGLALEDDGSTCVKTACNTNQRECEDGECVPAFTWCDGDRDCTDGSDESNCSTIECRSDQYRCNDGVCIDKNYRCDFLEDCRDGSDELSCEIHTCKSMEWQCESGECIPAVWRCDAIKHCEDHSDEKNCREIICKEDEKKCKYGTCVKSKWWCDGQDDCPHGEDEQNCSCELGEYNCDGKCVKKRKICEGEIICSKEPVNITCEPSDLIDEECSNQIPCMQSSNNLHCIPYELWCDGEPHCPGREDEENCERCKENEIKCGEADACVDEGWICDGQKDCINGFDEEGCSAETVPPIQSVCSSEEFQCPDGACIQKRKVCDGYEDCIDGVDEHGECETCKSNNGGCHHNCHESPIKITCSCKQGYELGLDKRSCHDVNECVNEDLCHHVCLNLKGTFLCSCHEGYNIMQDRHTCKPENGEHWPVAVLSNGYIKYLNEKLEVMERIKFHGLNFGYEPKSMKMIGVHGEMGLVIIQEKMIKQLLKENIMAVTYDYINSNLYIAKETILNREDVTGVSLESKIKTTVKIYNIKGLQLGTLFEVRDRKISAMEISLLHRSLFTCENSETQTILNARNLDGSDERSLVKDKIKNCNDLALDDDKRRVYWVDSTLNKIESVNYMGYSRKRFLSKKVHGPTSLAIVDHSLMWFNARHQTLVICSITHPEECKERLTNITQVIKMKRTYNFSIPSPCLSSNCPQICVPHTLKVPHCVCSDGFTNIEEKCLENEYYENLVTGSCENNPCGKGMCRRISEDRVMCECPENFTGKLCEVKIEASTERNNMLIFAIVILFISLILSALIYIYRVRLQNIWKKKWSHSRFRYDNSSLILLNEDSISQPSTPPELRNLSSEGINRQPLKV